MWAQLPFDIKISSHIFQKPILKIQKERYKRIIYQDAMWGKVYCRSETQNREIIEDVIMKAGMTISKDKCELNSNKVSYLGYQMPKNGISLDKGITKKIEMSCPKNKQDVEFFWWLTNL